MKVVTLFKMILVAMFAVLLIATPIACEYAANTGPEWMMTYDPRQRKDIVAGGWMGTCTLFALACAVSGVCLIVSIAKEE